MCHTGPATLEATQAASVTPPVEELADVGRVLAMITAGVDEVELGKAVSAHIRALVVQHGMQDYKLLVLFDERKPISYWQADRIYSAASAGDAKDILLVIHSNGGSIEPAYLISRACIRLAKGKFVVAVPRRAKSAATLISLGASEIHMGLMSELGPIDPQIGGFAALGMQNALSLLADLSCRYPGSSQLWSGFLSQKLHLGILGYSDRVSQSAVQYVERLLQDKEKRLPQGQTAQTLASHFVNYYKDHGFVIDADEAKTLLGDTIIHLDSELYKFANKLHQSLDLIQFVLGLISKKEFFHVGGIDDGPGIREKKDD